MARITYTFVHNGVEQVEAAFRRIGQERRRATNEPNTVVPVAAQSCDCNKVK